MSKFFHNCRLPRECPYKFSIHVIYKNYYIFTKVLYLLSLNFIVNDKNNFFKYFNLSIHSSFLNSRFLYICSLKLSVFEIPIYS